MMNPVEESKGLENLMHHIKESVSQDGLLSQGIPKDKEEEIQHLFDVLVQKSEVLKMLRDSPSATRSFERELSEKYVLGDKNSSERDPRSTSLFGILNMEFEEQVVKKEKCEKCNFVPAEMVYRGLSPKVDYQVNYLKVHLDLLNLKFAVHHQYTLTRTVVQQYMEQLYKALRLQKQKQQVVLHSSQVMNEEAKLLMLDTEIAVYEAMRDYFTEDTVVVEATHKLREVLRKEVLELKIALVECETQLAAYKKLEDTDFEDIVREYKDISATIDKKRWAIKQVVKQAEEDALSESLSSV